MLKVKGKHAKSTQARCSMWLPLMKLKQVINTACDPCFFFLGWNMMKVWWGKSRYHPQWSQSVRMSDSLGNHPSIYLSIHLNCLSLSRAAGGWSLSQHALGKRQVGHFTGKQTLQIRAGGPCWPTIHSLELIVTLICIVCAQSRWSVKTALPSYLIWSALLQMAHCKHKINKD